MSTLELPKKVQTHFDYVHWSIYMFNSALNELYIISDLQYNQEELKIVNSHPFDFYRVSLQYCVIMEYHKLLEKGRTNNKEHMASLLKLNGVIKADIGASYEKMFLKNELILDDIGKSEYYIKLRDLRDKKFGHSDLHAANPIFKFKGFNSQDFFQFEHHLKKIKEIVDNCTRPYNFSFDLDIPNRENRTRNFIKLHSEYKEYYFKNYFEAIKTRNR